jgi:hypothetical protein
MRIGIGGARRHGGRLTKLPRERCRVAGPS